MITEKQLGNYLAYAVGEIILIVIGILIALAINNSNQQRIIREKEQVYLQGLRDEFGTSKLKLEELIKVNRANYLGAKKLVAFMTDKETPPDEQTLSALLYNTFAFDIAFNPNNSLLNEMISSGSSKDISNPELRIRLTNWISTMEDISRQEADLDLQREKVLDIFRSDQYSIKTTLDQTETVSKEIGLPKSENPASNLGLLDSKEFENNVIMFIITSYYTETNHYTPLMQELEYILELINKEVEE
jgi:hypothetical protein